MWYHSLLIVICYKLLHILSYFTFFLGVNFENIRALSVAFWLHCKYTMYERRHMYCTLDVSHVMPFHSYLNSFCHTTHYTHTCSTFRWWNAVRFGSLPHWRSLFQEREILKEQEQFEQEHQQAVVSNCVTSVIIRRALIKHPLTTFRRAWSTSQSAAHQSVYGFLPVRFWRD